MSSISFRPSPNCRPRKEGENVRCVILHATWMADDEAALRRLCDPAAEVSCHYYITRKGDVIQLVSEDDVAWHAGKSSWNGLEGLNPFSLGIEIGNAGPFGREYPDGPPANLETQVDWTDCEFFQEAQYVALEMLLADILQRYSLKPSCVLGHDVVSPGRKTDPGPCFDRQRLQRAGVFEPSV